MASKKISAMTVLAAFADTDLIPIVDISETNDSDKNKAAEYRALQRAIDRKKSVKTKTSNYTILKDDFYVMADASAGATSITLPDATTSTGYEYVVIKIDNTNNVTIATTSSQTINGNASVTLTAQYDFKKVLSDGSNWVVVGTN